MEAVHTVRIDHGAVQNAALPFSQRQQVNHRPSHNQQSDLYKPSRSPLSAASRYPYPSSPQLQQQQQQPQSQHTPPSTQQHATTIVNHQVVSTAVVQQQQRYATTTPATGFYTTKQPRISLLHSDYGNGRAVAAAVAMHQVHYAADQQQQPFKKIRLQDGKEMQPLRIDTRDQPGSYTPKVEAISPTFPDPLQQEEQSSLRTTKDELLQQIGKVDREIAKTESQISILKKKEQELEVNASKPSVKPEVEEECGQQKHQSLAQKIYAENRKKAQQAHGKLDQLGPKVEWPIYNQPPDTTVYHENKWRHMVFKRRLLEYFKRRHADKETRNSYLSETYSKLMQDWMRNVEKLEASRKRKAKEARNREFFEKVFPELRKQREDKERFNRVGARIKSEADLEEIMDNLQEQAMEDKKMRSYAVIPPILLDAKDRKVTYRDDNGRIEDMEAVYKQRQFLNIWTPSEKEIFKEKYLQHPKNFGVIASYLERKSVADCVQYYYLSKKTDNYKQLLRKNRLRLRSRNNPQKVNSTANASVVDILSTGVRTRFQQQQKNVGQAAAAARPAEQPQTATTTSTSDAAANASSPSSSAATTEAAGTATPPPAAEPAPPEVAKSPQKDDAKKEEEEREKEGREEDAAKEDAADAEKEEATEERRVESDQPTAVECAPVTETKKKSDRRKDKETSAIETSEDEVETCKDATVFNGQCAVCSAQLGPHLQSRPLAPTQAAQYGLREDQIPPAGARVCNTCRCKCVRSRYTHCPLPGCPNSRGRVKRLRSLPPRLAELPHEAREPILAEFRVPSGVTKCCSACFNRIQRRLGPVEDWSEGEMGRLRQALTDLGANWQMVGERLGRPAHVVRGYYAANRKRLDLEKCLGDRKPTLTDEEESGSSTSSCEPIRERHSSDTASAESPQASSQEPMQSQSRKEDYDSSATETADERQTPEHYQPTATITPIGNDRQARQSSPPQTVKDLMLNVIEKSLMKNPQAVQQQYPTTSTLAPTISSILNNDSNEVTIVGEYNLGNRPQQRWDNLAKLVTPLIGATITPVPGPGQVAPEPPREDMVLVQVQQDPETLDLSVKKPREPQQQQQPPSSHQLHPGKPQHTVQIHKNEAYLAYHQQQERKSPLYASSIPRVQPKLPSPKPANPKTGSITLGTPIQMNQPRSYEGLLRQMTPEPKMGSITQGTPIHVPHMPDKRVYDYYNKRMPQPQQYTGYRQPTYSVEPQLSSRQIIMNDYITSQQMLGRRGEKPSYYPASSPHRTPPPPQPQQQPQQVQQQQQQRQGVIQRHIRPHYPPGHEALSSLVDVAVQQPSLPVPSAPHEGLGKTMADNIMEQPHRLQILQQQQQQQHQLRQQQQQRMEAERRAAAYQQQLQQQQHNHLPRQVRQQQPPPPRSESSTLTAASLIDAIITHQINQTAEGGRNNPEMVANSRGEPPRTLDRLFQSFHREQPQQQQQPDNGERSPPVINVDLDGSDQMSKNLTVKELTDTVISHDFNSGRFYHVQDARRRGPKEAKRSGTPQDERHIIRIAQPQQQQQKWNVEPVSPPETNHWAEQKNYRRYQQPQSHISALDYVKNRIVEVMRTEDDKKEQQEPLEKERSDSPGEMVIDEEKHDEQQQQQSQYGQQYGSGGGDAQPKPLLSEQYEPLSDED